MPFPPNSELCAPGSPGGAAPRRFQGAPRTVFTGLNAPKPRLRRLKVEEGVDPAPPGEPAPGPLPRASQPGWTRHASAGTGQPHSAPPTAPSSLQSRPPRPHLGQWGPEAGRVGGLVVMGKRSKNIY